MKVAAPILVLTALFALSGSAGNAGPVCPEGQILAGGEVDEAVFARAASRGVRGEWCERYDTLGRAERIGPYRERYPSGALRLEATYVDGRIQGPVVAYHENGRVFVRGEIDGGAWGGALSLYHENGLLFWAGDFAKGRLDGRVELRHPEGGLAAESQFQNGREDGAARSFYPRVLGGGVQSEVHVEADTFVGLHRVFDTEGKVLLRADRDRAPADWVSTPPVAAAAASPDKPGTAHASDRAAND